MNGPVLSPSSRPQVLLVGYEDRDNLGLRYLLSSLHAAGVSAEIIRYDRDPSRLLSRALRDQPLVIGFSLIFQYMAPDYARTLSALRDGGVRAHLTMGGHYPSFDWEEVLRRMPTLDSVVRFEGEATLVELVQRLAAGQEWQDILGLACRRDGQPLSNPLRPPIQDLDLLPPPDRQSYAYEAEDLPTAAILGSRGCPWHCTFCSIRPFYEAQGGALRRYRSPAAVAAEMAALHHERGVRLFLFQDDDFLGGGPRAQRWGVEVADAIIAAGLEGRIAWKVSCRSDEVHPDTMRALKRAGLTHVYMGVESGSPHDLADMRKHIKPERHLAAGEVLRSLGLSFDFGFMLLQPYSTLESVGENIRFLDEFVRDGWTVSGFCRMLPYAGTPIRDRLAADGRLLGTAFDPDYRFLDPRLDLYYAWMMETFRLRNFSSEGLSHLLRALHFELNLNSPENRITDLERRWLRYLTANTNQLATYALGAALDHVSGRSVEQIQRDPSTLGRLTAHVQREEERLMDQVLEFYATVQARAEAPGRLPRAGGFDRAWTTSELAQPG